MKKMVIFEPAMCCSTGVCGPSVDKELLRVSTVLSNLKSNGVVVERHNLTSNPLIFVQNQEINSMLDKEGIEILPVVMVDGKVVKTKGYPNNEEICSLLNITEDYLKASNKNEDKGCCDPNSGCC
ncbi:arsenite efflux transporter metallochaperone ArsD [Alkaliphilus oremlandii]|uniref:Arsenical resistance operon trans-acting repressor ArsD n=1 Tax=Alkaliphilus oremlandii (strain OhILAs) TaxID=350688 RepID=A8MGW1_ALKOO|nr:arsenite efflux transporter metallochaperone ArsD [Alkaliphilus oremlandii]ABW18655.1 Arsenical resistance operon trans-acting repressor ArsD [Alkaliphilus oremlandii OhILAs]